MVVAVEEIYAIGYIRQSDEREDKEDISEQTQLVKIQQFCDINGWKLVKVFKDIDYSGFRISYTKRPGIMEALEYLKNDALKKVKKFVAFNLSRITRQKKDFNLIHETLKKLEVDICSASELLDFSSPTGRLVTSILVDFNEYYSDNLSDVTMENKKTNAMKGRWNGGPAPFGLVKINDSFAEDGYKAEAIKKCFRMAKSGKGTFVISKWMNDQGIRTETGKHWTPRRMRYVLTNSTYAGMQRWGGEYYPLNDCPKLVSWEDFQYIQDTLFGKENAWKGKERQLLSSVLRCPVCGSKMHSRQTLSKKTRRYMCSQKNMPGGCKSAVIDLPTLNDSVIQAIAATANERYSKSQLVPRMADKREESLEAIQKLRAERARLEQAKQNVFDDYYLNSKLTEEQFNALMKRYEDRQKEIDELLQKIPLPSKNQYGDFDDIMSIFGEGFMRLSEQDRRKFIELLVEKIIPDSPTIIKFRWGEEKIIPIKETVKYKSPVYFY